MSKKALRIALVLIIAGILALLYLYGATIQLKTVNVGSGSDQGGTLGYAKNFSETHYTYVGDRNRMPLYPLLLAPFYRDGMSDDEYLRVGKTVNIALSLALLPALFAITSSFLRRHQAANLVLIYMFSVSLFKAAYAQCELLFYFINFAGFLLLSWLLVKPGWKLGLLAGVVLALGHLTKASVLPGLALFFLCLALRGALILYRALRARPGSSLRAQGFRPLAQGGLACLVAFLAVLSPYLANSKRVYGRYFYNVNSTFYIWYDSWDDAKAGTRAYGDRVGWPTMPADQIPSLQKYLREHSPDQMVRREWQGLLTIVDRNLGNGYGYAKYLFLSLIAALGLSLLRLRHSLALARGRPFLFLFWLSFFLVYLALYAWYVPIANGIRLVLGQFLPIMFVLSLVIASHSAKVRPLRIAGRELRLQTVLDGSLSLLLAVDVYFILAYRIATTYGGH